MLSCLDPGANCEPDSDKRETGEGSDGQSSAPLVRPSPGGPGGTAINLSPVRAQQPCVCHVPRVVFHGTKAEELGDLHGGHGVLHVLLIGKDQDGSISQSLWTEEPSPSQPARIQPPFPWPRESSLPPLLSQVGWGWRSCPTLTTTSSDTDSSWNASQPHSILTMISGGRNLMILSVYTWGN